MYMDYRPCKPGTGLRDLYFWEGSRDTLEFLKRQSEIYARISLFERIVYDFKKHHPLPDLLGRHGMLHLMKGPVFFNHFAAFIGVKPRICVDLAAGLAARWHRRRHPGLQHDAGFSRLLAPPGCRPHRTVDAFGRPADATGFAQIPPRHANPRFQRHQRLVKSCCEYLRLHPAAAKDSARRGARANLRRWLETDGTVSPQWHTVGSVAESVDFRRDLALTHI